MANGFIKLPPRACEKQVEIDANIKPASYENDVPCSQQYRRPHNTRTTSTSYDAMFITLW